ncbi:Outer membrane usher protein HtrE precursor [Haemophilus influenzae]|uniref:fimbria/pilus outer membrane usher protein n=1 Tax=Haemophilus influenzae TaxID=727 RepID=UPI000D011F8B|nr:fimbria/pilus outer membrane usher protein [Haemophilus influenzae]PRM15882.1 Outer membrane usher protein HtrE precursor [Haemophilus influenzae]
MKLATLTLNLRYHCLLLGAVGFLPLFAIADSEFDAGFLRQADNSPIVDISRFNQKNAVLAGDYPADIFVNNANKGSTELHFAEVDGQPMLCLTTELASILDLQSAAFLRKASDSDCVPLKSALSQAKVEFDTGLLRLDVEIPQALTIQRPRDYILPSRWQDGEPAVFLNYNVNHYRYNSFDAHSHQSYLGIRAGANLGSWAVRHSGARSWSYANGTHYANHYEASETYLQKDFVAIRGLITAGDFYTSGELMEGVNLRGLKVASDDRMLPPSQRGYAPIVQGVANSNANVKIRQNGSVIYQTSVPAGPFTISDIYPSGYSGDLVVEITESNGQTRTFTVPFANVAPLIRMGHFRYQMAYGRYRYGTEVYSDKVLQASLQYGLSNHLTLNTGMTHHEKYRAGLMGVGLNTPIGAFSADATVAQATLEPREKKYGHSLHASYSVNMLATKTNLTLAAYRYYSKDFYRLRDVIADRNNGINISPVVSQNIYFARPKNQYQISINQDLGEKWGNIYLVGSTYNYWGRNGSRNEYQLSYNNRYRMLSYQFGFSQSIDNETGRRDNNIYLSFSLPLGENYLSSTFTRSSGYSSVQSAFSGSLGKYNQFNYGVSAATDNRQSRFISTNASYIADIGDYQFSVGQDNKRNRQMSLNASGSIVGHRYGVTLGQAVGDSFAIIHAKGARGALVTATGSGQRLDYFGNAIVPYTSPYSLNYIGIEPTDAPANIEFNSTEQQIVPRANSINVIDFGAKKNTMVLFNVTAPSGVILPMAAEAKDEKGNVVGYVGQGGVLFANHLTQSKGTLSVAWGSHHSDQCRFDYRVNLDDEAEEMQIYDVKCQ